MFAALLLACACWTGDADPSTTYKIYWSSFPVAWYAEKSAPLVVQPLCAPPADTPAPVVCAEWRHLVPDPPKDRVYFVLVTAVNRHGESPTEHGCVN